MTKWSQKRRRKREKKRERKEEKKRERKEEKKSSLYDEIKFVYLLLCVCVNIKKAITFLCMCVCVRVCMCLNVLLWMYVSEIEWETNQIPLHRFSLLFLSSLLPFLSFFLISSSYPILHPSIPIPLPLPSILCLVLLTNLFPLPPLPPLSLSLLLSNPFFTNSFLLSYFTHTTTQWWSSVV